MEIGGFFYQPEPVPVEWRLFRKTRDKMGITGCPAVPDFEDWTG